jgi:hypothetical protein
LMVWFAIVAGSAGPGTFAPGPPSRDCKTTSLKGWARIDTRRSRQFKKYATALSGSRYHPIGAIPKAFR